MSKTDEELIQLAKDIWAGQVFTDRQCRSANDVALVFLPLVFMEQPELDKLKAEDITMFYEYLDKAGPRTINGMPSFFSMQLLTREENDRLAKYLEQVKSAMAEIK